MSKILLAISITLTFWFSLNSPVNSQGFQKSAAQKQCSEKWTKRGQLDSNMFNYCMKRQNEGYNELSFLKQKYGSLGLSGFGNYEDIVNFAFAKWTTRDEIQYDMVAYTIEKQAEGFLDLAYIAKNQTATKSRIGFCLSKWATPKSPQYDMVVYCLKK